VSEEFAAMERGRLWPRVWLLAAHQSQLASRGDRLALDVAGSPLVLVHDGDRPRAFHDTCRHRGARVSGGKLAPCMTGSRVEALVCPNHGWRYDLGGRLVLTPHAARPDKVSLAEVACERRHGFVWIALEPEHAGSLDAFLAPIADALAELPSERLRVVHHARMVVPCNWKTSSDTHNEGYHLAWLHPELAGSLDPRDVTVEVRPPHSRIRVPLTRGGRRLVKHQTYVFPHVQLNWGEGEDAIELYRHTPHGPSPAQAAFEELRLGPGEGPARFAELAYGEASMGPITDADLAMLPVAQAGLASRAAEPFRLTPLEAPIGVMHAELRQRLGLT
jgi:phenylpropionate dioxygenase-like ring-hydroxylating dioxygenase large terminal subunit